jgi:hypothetical protein
MESTFARHPLSNVGGTSHDTNASVAGTKVFVEDLGANGLSAKRSENQPFDSFESNGTRTAV